MNIHEIIKNLLKNIPNPNIFEIGVRAFEDSEILIKDNLRSGNYWGFEPLPGNIKEIMTRISSDPELEKLYLSGKVNVYDIALSDEIGESDFYVSSDPANFNGSSSLKKPTNHLTAFPNIKFEEVIKVKTTTLDQFCLENYIKNIDFCWCDTQGNEWDVIKGGQDILKRCRFFYGEHYGEDKMYESQGTLKEWQSALPGKWKELYRFPNESLMMNEDVKK